MQGIVSIPTLLSRCILTQWFTKIIGAWCIIHQIWPACIEGKAVWIFNQVAITFIGSVVWLSKCPGNVVNCISCVEAPLKGVLPDEVISRGPYTIGSKAKQCWLYKVLCSLYGLGQLCFLHLYKGTVFYSLDTWLFILARNAFFPGKLVSQKPTASNQVMFKWGEAVLVRASSP